jgi:hypothetical protein
MSLESNGEFQSLFDLAPEEYYGCVYTINENRRLTLAEKFDGVPLDLRTHAIILTGSDGKSERHTQSKTEMTILTTNTEGNPAASMANWYKNKYGADFNERFDVSPTGLPEVKVVPGDAESSPSLAYAYGDRNLVYPDRVLNSQLLLGNESILSSAKRQVLAGITADDEAGRRIRKEIESQGRAATKGLTSGEYRHATIFFLEPPQQYYDEDRQHYSVGFKLAGLRPVQRMIDLLTIRAIRSKGLAIEDAISFPTNTVARVEALSERGLAPDASKLIPAYQWFLQQYHVAQDHYKATRSGVKVPFNKDDFLTHRDAVVDFRDSMKHVNYKK